MIGSWTTEIGTFIFSNAKLRFTPYVDPTYKHIPWEMSHHNVIFSGQRVTQRAETMVVSYGHGSIFQAWNIQESRHAFRSPKPTIGFVAWYMIFIDIRQNLSCCHWRYLPATPLGFGKNTLFHGVRSHLSHDVAVERVENALVGQPWGADVWLERMPTFEIFGVHSGCTSIKHTYIYRYTVYMYIYSI